MRPEKQPQSVDDFKIRESGVPGWGTANHGIAPFIRLRRGSGMGLGSAVLLALLLFCGIAAVATLKWPNESRRGLEIARGVALSAIDDLGIAAGQVTPNSASESAPSTSAEPASAAVVTTASTRAPSGARPAPALRQTIAFQQIAEGRQMAIRRTARSSWSDEGDLQLVVVDDEDQPVPNARVRVVSVMPSTATTPFDDFTDEYGRVAVGPLGAGYVAITIDDQTVRRTMRANIEAGQRTDVTLATPVGAAVIGVVRDADGRPIPGATIRSAPRPRAPGSEGVIEDSLKAVSDTNGVYRMINVPVGEHELLVVDAAHPRRVTQVQILDVPHRGTLTRDLSSSPLGAPSPATRLPNSVAAARSESRSSALSVARRAPPKHERGTPSSNHVQRQKTVALPSRSGAPTQTPVARRASADATDTRLRFRLTDERGEPFVGDVTIALLPTDGAAHASTTNLTVYGRGVATFDEAIPGSYRISLRATGHEPATLLSEISPGRNEIRAILARLPDPPARYRLHGTIVDRTTGHPIPGCRVVVRGEPDRFAFSTVDGRFFVSSPDARPTGVWVTHEGYASELAIAPVDGPLSIRMTPRSE